MKLKSFSASTIKKIEPDDDIDVDGIEDRLSPVVEEPVSLINFMLQKYSSIFLISL